MPGLVPGIHILLFGGAKTWMAGTSPAMTKVRQVTPSTFALRATADRPTDLPDGLFCKSPVQPLLQKYFRSGLTQITSISLTVPSHRGAIARRHERGAGCGGRESVRRAMAIAGRDEPRERFAARKMIGALADGEAVWFWHPLLVLNSRRLVGPTGRRQNLNPRMTVTRRIRRRGEHEISR